MSALRKRTARVQARFYIRVLQLLGLFGAGFLVSCDRNNDIVPMYGTEPGDGTIRFYGTIQSADSLKNIPGLTVRLVKNDGWDSIQTVTNGQGQYLMYDYAFEGDMLKLKVIDTDSAANVGNFKKKVVDIEISSRDANNFERQQDVLLEKK